MAVDIHKILDEARALGCSDLHFTVGIPPIVRQGGNLRKLSSYPDMTEIDILKICEDMCTGYSPFAFDVKETSEDPIRNIAEAYLGKAPCARMRPIDERIDHAVRLAEEYKADAVIYYYMKFCPCYGLPKNEFVKRFQEKNIPVLEMPVDYSVGDEGQIKTRIEAFIDVLEEK